MIVQCCWLSASDMYIHFPQIIGILVIKCYPAMIATFYFSNTCENMDITRDTSVMEGPMTKQDLGLESSLIDIDCFSFLSSYIATFRPTSSQSSLGPIMFTDCRARSAAVR